MESKETTALFIGNRDCYNVKDELIEQAIITAIEAGITTFLNGGQGYFDRRCASIVHSLKKRYPFIRSHLVIPYRTFESRDCELFDEIIFPFEEHIESCYTYMGNIEKRNRFMVNQSYVAICFLNHTTGGAGKTLAYARKRNLIIIDVKAKEIHVAAEE